MTVHRLSRKEPLPENRSLLNQRCRVALLKSKEVPDPHSLYSLQLADLALQKGWYSPLGYECQETVSQMFGWKPSQAQRYLEKDARGDDQELLSKGNLSPRQIAAEVLKEIELKLSLPSASNYPTLPKPWK